MYLQPLNKISMLKKDSPTSLAVAPIAEQSVNNAMVAVTQEVTIPDLGKCMTLLAPPAANQLRFLSGPAVTGLFIVATATPEKAADINFSISKNGPFINVEGLCYINQVLVEPIF